MVAVWPCTRATGTTSVYRPSSRVSATTLSPSTVTLAELRGALPSMLVTVPVIVTASCAAASAGSASMAHTKAITDLTDLPMLPPCHLFQKVCGRRWSLSGWLSDARGSYVRPDVMPLRSSLLVAVRLHAAARHTCGDLWCRLF